jgi:hypothetical protein
VSFAAISLYVPSQQVFIAVVYFVIDSVRKLLDIPSCITLNTTAKYCPCSFSKFCNVYTSANFNMSVKISSLI